MTQNSKRPKSSDLRFPPSKIQIPSSAASTFLRLWNPISKHIHSMAGKSIVLQFRVVAVVGMFVALLPLLLLATPQRSQPIRRVARSRISVYVYDLPPRYNADVLHGEPQPGHATEVALHRLLQQPLDRTDDQQTLVTRDPEEATLFYVPVYAARFLDLQGGPLTAGALTRTAEFVEDALRHVQQNHPYWKRFDGRDHFIVASHNHGRCSVLSKLEIQGDTEITTLQTQSGCFLPHMDVVIPAFIPGPPTLSDGVERTTEAVYVNGSDTASILTAKDALVCACSSVAALSAAVVSGCVPVLEGRRETHWPWEETLDYTKFSLFVDPVDGDSRAALVKQATELARDKQELQNKQSGFGAQLRAALNRKVEGFSAESSSAYPSETLFNKGTALKLCRPAEAPFVTGTYHTATKQTQLIVFEAELLKGFVPGTKNLGRGDELMVQLLAFVEDDASIRYSSNSWGGAWLGEFANSKKLHLSCDFFEGHGRLAQVSGPLFSVPALIASYTQEYSLLLHCPLPSLDQLPLALLRASKLQIQLSSSDPEELLHMPPLPLCREGEERKEEKDRREEKVEVKVEGKAGICLYPYREHRAYYISGRKNGNRTESLLEWIDYHLLLGVSKVFFYDRYGDEKLPLVHKYVERGSVVHVPFPMWSEVFYRRETFINTSNPYSFPAAYDQILAYEHCMMQGRRHNFSWLFFIDTDEYLAVKDGGVGSLPRLMSELERKHGRALPLAALRIKRFNFLGTGGGPRPSLRNVTRRCPQPMQHTYIDWSGKFCIDSHDKLGAAPHRMVGSKVEIHFTKQTPEAALGYADPDLLKIHHYASTSPAEYKKFNINFRHCPKIGSKTEEDDPVEDRSLVWAGKRIMECRERADCYDPYSVVERCGKMCGEKRVIKGQ